MATAWSKSMTLPGHLAHLLRRHRRRCAPSSAGSSPAPSRSTRPAPAAPRASALRCRPIACVPMRCCLRALQLRLGDALVAHPLQLRRGCPPARRPPSPGSCPCRRRSSPDPRPPGEAADAVGHGALVAQLHEEPPALAGQHAWRAPPARGAAVVQPQPHEARTPGAPAPAPAPASPARALAGGGIRRAPRRGLRAGRAACRSTPRASASTSSTFTSPTTLSVSCDGSM